ncbi:MAG: VOC family protein [Pyrinomonadaceae bacterium]
MRKKSISLWYDSEAREAADFYCSVFENASIKSENPVVVEFEIEGQDFIGINGGPRFEINPSISMFFNSESAEELQSLWAKLSDGGKIMMPLDNYPWSECYGWCEDKYGVSWQLMKGDIGGQKVVPCLMFTGASAGKAEEAMNFYCSVFEGSEITEINRYEAGEHDVEGTIKHAQFHLGGQYFAAMDSSMPHEFAFDEGVSIVVYCDNQDEIDYFWGKLTDGGNEGRCGWLVDKFGVHWQVVPSMMGELMSTPERSDRVMKAFMPMNKLDLDVLVAAAKGA